MSEIQPIPAGLEKLASAVVDSAFKVHSELGPGLLESVYESCLAWELSDRGLSVLRQVTLPVVYAGRELEAGLKLDLLVNNELIMELKAVDKVLPVHKAQLLTYLKLTRKRLGLLINFNVELIRDGIQRVALLASCDSFVPLCLCGSILLPSGSSSPGRCTSPAQP